MCERTLRALEQGSRSILQLPVLPAQALSVNHWFSVLILALPLVMIHRDVQMVEWAPESLFVPWRKIESSHLWTAFLKGVGSKFLLQNWAHMGNSAYGQEEVTKASNLSLPWYPQALSKPLFLQKKVGLGQSCRNGHWKHKKLKYTYFSLQRNLLVVCTSSGEQVLAPPHFQMLSTSRTLGRERRDQKTPRRNFIISEEWAGICYGLE